MSLRFVQLLPCFPVIRPMSEQMMMVAEKLRDAEKGVREDLNAKVGCMLFGR